MEFVSLLVTYQMLHILEVYIRTKYQDPTLNGAPIASTSEFLTVDMFLFSLLSSGYQGLFPWGQSSRRVKLTTHPL
jgi:hypothetical protein